MIQRLTTDLIVIHGSLTLPHIDFTIDDIRHWHVDEKGYDDVGYHYVIRRNGLVQTGRDINLKGAHSPPVNAHSVGICLIGGMSTSSPDGWEFNYSHQQMDSLLTLIRQVQSEYPACRGDNRVVGHRDVQTGRRCPGFNVGAWFYGR